MILQNIEFSDLPDGNVEVRMLSANPFILEAKHRDLVSSLLLIIRNRYPIAFDNLNKRYEASATDKWYFEYLIVRGFIKCNMGNHDHKMDIDADGILHFEFRQCPLAGECKEWKQTCQPKENLEISDAEIRVLRLITKGEKVQDIAHSLCISPKTVENHTQNMLRKLGLHNNAGLVNYWHTHKLK